MEKEKAAGVAAAAEAEAAGPEAANVTVAEPAVSESVDESSFGDRTKAGTILMPSRLCM